jgi:hypothetical protein
MDNAKPPVLAWMSALVDPKDSTRSMHVSSEDLYSNVAAEHNRRLGLRAVGGRLLRGSSRRLLLLLLVGGPLRGSSRRLLPLPVGGPLRGSSRRLPLLPVGGLLRGSSRRLPLLPLGGLRVNLPSDHFPIRGVGSDSACRLGKSAGQLTEVLTKGHLVVSFQTRDCPFIITCKYTKSNDITFIKHQLFGNAIHL